MYRYVNQVWYKKLLPETRIEWAITGGIVLYLLIGLLSALDPVFPIWVISPMKAIGNITLVLTFTALIADRIKKIGEDRRSWRNILMLIISMVIPLTCLSGALSAYYVYSTDLTLFVPERAQLESMAEKLREPDLPPDIRSQLSKFYAKKIYSDYGRIIQYITPDGTSILYEPTLEDKRFRDTVLEGRELFVAGKSSALTVACVWSGAIMVGIFSGVLILKNTRREYGT